MFGLSAAEAAVIVLVALVVLGPDKLPGALRALAKGWAALTRLRTEFDRVVTSEMNALKKDAGVTEIKELDALLGERTPAAPPPAETDRARDEAEP
jgi:Sec-independent protein translocase protein TatA